MKLTKPFFAILFIILVSTSIYAQSKASKIEDLLQRYYDYGLLNGSALVSEDGNIIFEKGFGFANMEWNVPNTPDTKFRIGSVSKQFTATIIMQLVEEGKIKLDAKITDYLPNYRKDTGDKVTIHHLLNHTSGITPYTSLPGVWSDSLRNHYKQDYFIEHFHSGDLQFEPGSKYTYNNTGYYLLSVIAEKVTGKNFGELLKERIFNPLKMRDTGSEDDELIVDKKASGYLRSGRTFQVDPYMFMPNATGAGHMYSTVEDMLLWDRALHSTKILSEESKKKMFTPYLSNYGYGWIIVKDTIKGTKEPITITTHDGGINGFNTSFFRILEKKIMIAIFNNTGNAPLQEMVGKITQILFDEEFQYPKRPILDYVAGIVETEGIEAAISAYKKVKLEEFDSYDFSEQQLNNLGYYYLQNGRMDEALAIFKLNIEAFPLASNPYDSYAEALMAKGDKEGAIENYKKSIDINPGNANGIEKLKELGVEYKKELTVENKILSRYAGNYQLFPNFIIIIRVDGDKIFAQATGQAEFEIFPSSETKFYYKVVNAQIEFVANENGDFNKMILYQNNREMPGERVK